MSDYYNGYNGGGPGEASQHYESSSGVSGSTGQCPPRRRREKQSVTVGGVVVLCLLCSILAAALGVGGTWFVLRSGVLSENAAVTEVETVPTEAPQTESAGKAEGAPAVVPPSAVSDVGERIYDLAKQQVVGITTEIIYTNIFGQVSPASVSGSGFIIREDGYIITNNHVIEEARKGDYDISVLAFDGTEYAAQIVGYDEENDIAVLKIDAENLTPVTMGGEEDIVVGREVYPVGNPLGELNFTMTTGIISATDRVITTENDSDPINMFQIDAAVNNGNSGGPVYDGEGQVIGVVTAKKSDTGVEGLGFAIPIEDAYHVALQIIQYGYVKDRATLGITGSTVTSAMAERYGMVVGAYVSTVEADSPAEKAGIQARDILTALDDRELTSYTDLTTALHEYQVGDVVEITVWRGGKVLTVEAELGESQRPVETITEKDQYGYGSMDDFIERFFGGFAF